MAEWNLSVRLTGQGSSLARTLRSLSRDARQASDDVNALTRDITRLRAEARRPIRVRVDVDTAHLRRDVSAALDAAGAGQGLGVRLRIDTAHLRRDVSAALDAAGAGQGIGIRLGIDAAHLRADVSAALSAAGAGQALGVRLGLDAAHLRGDVSAALSTASAGQAIRIRLDVDAAHLRQDVSAALTSAGAGQGLAVNLRLGNAMQLRREVDAAVRWAAWGHRIEIPLVLADRMQLRRDVSAAVRWASDNQVIRVRVQPDTSALRNLPNTLPGGGSGGGSGGGRFGLLAGLIPIATAAIPLVGGLTASLGPLTGMLFATGGAATAFGIALAGQIGPLSEAADAEKKYQDAVRDHGASSAEAMEAQLAYQRQLAALPPETQRAAVALSNLKEEFGDWSDDLAGFTMAPVEKGFAVIEELLPHLTPEVESFSGSMDRLMNVAGGAVSTPGFDAISDRVAELTDAELDDFTAQVVHLLRVVSEGDADAGPIGDILRYFAENGDEARVALDAIGDAVSTLAQGAAQAGPTMLTLVTATARLVAALPPEAVAIILQVVTALKLLQLAGAGAAAVAAGIGRVRAAITALGATAAAAGGGIAGLRAALLSLGVAAKASVVVAGIGLLALAVHKLNQVGESAPPNVDKLTTSLGNLGRTGKATGYVAQKFGADFGKLNDQIKKVTNPSVVESINNWGEDITGGLLDAGEATEEFRKNTDAIDESLTNLVRNGNAKLAQAALAEMLKGLDPKEAQAFRSELDNYDQALADLAFEQKLTAESQGLFGAAAQETSAKLDAQKASADGLRQSILALNEVNRAAGSAMSAFEQSIDDATEAAKDHASALSMRNGDLDLGSEKAREAEKVLSDLAANTDAAATAAREQGRSWEYVNGIFERGRDSFVEAAQAMGLNKEQAQALAQQYMQIPDKKATTFEMRTEDAITGLNSVISAIKKTPDAKSVTVKALTTDAVHLLESLGFKVKQLPDGQFKVTAETGAASSRLKGIQAQRDGLKNKTITLAAIDRASAAVREIQAAIAGLRDRTVTITTVRQTIAENSTDTRPYTGQGGVSKYADGGIARAADGLFVPGYAPRRDIVPAILSPGEGVLVPETVRKLGLATGMGGEGVIGALNAWGRNGQPMRFADGGLVPQQFADGGVTSWRYDPSTGSLYSASDIGSAGNKTKKVQVKGKNGKTSTKEVAYYDIGAAEKKLKAASKATSAWNKNLEKVADRVGGDVAEALAAMGEDGMKLAAKMATGSTKYINEMAAALRNLQKTAKASLTDYTRQLTSANKLNKTFSDNLAKLAAQGYGDLAAQLAEQGDEAAQQLAAAAVKDKKKAASANKAAKTANTSLTAEQVTELVQIIAAIKTKATGIHDVAGTTGLGEDEIITVANKAKAQITSALGSRAARFLADLGKANKHQAYADGGIRAGLYATSGGIVRFAEPSTRGEAYIPLSPTKRRTALPVLADVATRFGVGLQDASAGRPVVVVKSGDTTQVTVTPVRTGATATDIAAQVGRSVRRARRGGVAARAA